MKNLEGKMSVQFFEDSNALDSLRHSDFDALSAYGEVIDNALQAEAKKIAIRMDCSKPRANYHQIKELVFGDDGHGMPKDVLHSCLKLGWSSRYNDRSGIGRFGVGMVLGAIHEVRRIEVYSKEKGSVWRYTYIDLDDIENALMTTIPEPIEKDIPEKYTGLIGPDHGTIVIWSKYDKQKKSGNVIAKEAKHWIGRTFRYFIWDGIEIVLNSEIVQAHDPLYIRTKNNRFPDDPIGTEYKTIPLMWKVSGSDLFDGAREESKIEIKLSLLPEEFRPKQGSGGSALATERYIDKNEGISILRNRREVFYGTIPYWSSVRWDNKGGKTWAFEDPDRFWGCEILFLAELDSDFSVRNIKRGADPLPDLKATIKQMITPTRNSAREEVSRVWIAAKRADEEAQDEEEAKAGGGAHKSAESIAKKTPTPKSKYNADVAAEDAANDILDKALSDQDEDKRAAIKAMFSSQPFTIRDSDWRGSTFWEVFHAGGNTFLSYNKRHEFFNELYRLMGGLEDETLEPLEVAKNVRILIDLLLISAAKAQSLHDEEATIPRIGDFVEDYNQQWGMMLSNYVKSWLREQDE